MRNGSGKGTKRKAETNFVDAYAGASQLAPPPASKDVFAVPAKLRKIMRLQSLMNGGVRNDGQRDPRAGKGGEKKVNKAAKKPFGGKDVKSHGVKGINGTSKAKVPEINAGSSEQPVKEKKGSFGNKWKKGEEELKRLVEKLDRREKIGVKHGVSERRKSFLNEKKKKKKRKGAVPDADGVQALNQYDKVEFGDVVQAPPKLTFPRKAAAVVEKVKLQGHQAVMMEKMRSEAIESYRKRRESTSLGGQQLRVLKFTAVEE